MTNSLDSMGIVSALKSIEAFPLQCEQAWNDIKNIDIKLDGTQIQNVVVCGMGGSRFTPLSIKECFKTRIKVPYEICDDYFLPNYINKNTLVVLSSYSGTTEEVLSCAEEALTTGCKICVIAKGGRLSEFAKENKLPAYIFEEKHNPSQQPRLGVGYMLFGHLGILFKYGLLDISDSEVGVAIDNTKNFKNEQKTDEISELMYEKETFVITSEHLRGFANGFANQINENAKALSSFRYISELNHHLMEGLTNPEVLKDKLVFVFIKSDLYNDRIKKRFDITKEVVEKQGILTSEIMLSSNDRLSNLLEAFMYSGFITLKLSQKYAIDPTKIPWVDYFKEKLNSLN